MDYEQLHSAVTKLLAKTQKEMEKLIGTLNLERDSLRTNNDTLTLYAKQLQVKVKEQESIIEQYEKTLLVLVGRLQDKSKFISEQMNKQTGGIISETKNFK